jgi:hypothetical protein
MAVEGLVPFEVTVEETNLFILAERDLTDVALRAVKRARKAIRGYAEAHPGFFESLEPLPADPGAPRIVREMCQAGLAAGVGPMAAVAGAIAEQVSRAALQKSRSVIVENGGDVFLAGPDDRVVAVDAGASPLSGEVGVRLPGKDQPLSICTSSGTVGPSLSFGRADAVAVVAKSGALADAAATALANIIRTRTDLDACLAAAQQIKGVRQVVAIIGDALGVWGCYELVRT